MDEIIFSNFYKRFFGAAPGEISLRFWKNIKSAFFGEGSVILISLFVYFTAVRYLGPTEFGKWSLIGSIGELLAILPLMGLASASLVFLGKGDLPKKKLIGSAVWTVAVLSFFLFPAYFIIESFLSYIITIDSALLKMGIVYAFFVLWAQLFQSFFKGTGQFKKLSKFLILSAFIFALITISLIFAFGVNTFESLLFGNIARASSLAISGLFVFRKDIFHFSSPAIQALSSYGVLSMTSAILGYLSLGSIDNIMINYYIDTKSVGIYAAYYMVFGLIIGKVLGTALQVFLPLISKIQDVRPVLKKSAAILIPSSVILFIFSVLATKIAFLLYGDKFVFDLSIAILVSIAATLYFVKSPFESILASRGVSGMKFGPLIAMVLGVSNVVFNILLIPRFELQGAALGTALSALVTLILILYLIRRNFTGPKLVNTP